MLSFKAQLRALASWERVQGGLQGNLRQGRAMPQWGCLQSSLDSVPPQFSSVQTRAHGSAAAQRASRAGRGGRLPYTQEVKHLNPPSLLSIADTASLLHMIRQEAEDMGLNHTWRKE